MGSSALWLLYRKSAIRNNYRINSTRFQTSTFDEWPCTWYVLSTSSVHETFRTRLTVCRVMFSCVYIYSDSYMLRSPSVAVQALSRNVYAILTLPQITTIQLTVNAMDLPATVYDVNRLVRKDKETKMLLLLFCFTYFIRCVNDIYLIANSYCWPIINPKISYAMLADHNVPLF